MLNEKNITSKNENDTEQPISIREKMPEILKILLIDRTKSTAAKTKNIIWATDHYIQYGLPDYAETSPIHPDLVKGIMGKIIVPRALKAEHVKKDRTKTKAEVFTPTWIVKKQNDEVDKSYQEDDFETYIKRKWLEITCGEAPYMVTRYDMETGATIPLEKRVGFVDRKLKRISQNIACEDEWHKYAILAYQSSYGFEWSGDSLLLARENLLETYIDYYEDKFSVFPSKENIHQIAETISYNVFQMDGLKYIIPLSETREKNIKAQLSLFDDEPLEEEWIIKPGKRVKIMNWETNKMEFFDKGIK